MIKKSAMSAMGYAIVSVIILGIVMIVSAPMLVNSVKDEKQPEPVQNYEKEEISQDYSEMRELERKLSSRIDELERRQSTRQDTITDKYICSIEGSVDEYGNIVPMDSPNKTEKFVFVCEYRR